MALGLTGVGRALTLSMLVDNAWRASPASTAAKWSYRGEKWERHPHLSLISDYVRRTLYEPLRLIVSIPPRHGKTQLISLWTPIWYLANNPTHRVGLTTYAAALANMLGRKARDTIEATPELGIKVRSDMRGADLFGTDSGGYMMSTSIGGPMTGHGYNLLIIDDPIKDREAANSPLSRQKMWDWWTSTARTRLEPGGSVIVLMTRWHEDDIVGRMLDNNLGERYEHINLPAIAESPDDPLGRKEGDALWPERYSSDHLINIIQPAVGPADWAGLFQQRPAPLKGGFFERGWWEIVQAVPTGGKTVRGWDLAATAQGGDYTCGCKMTLVNGIYYIEDMVRERFSASDVERLLVTTASQDRTHVIQDLPQDTGQSGKSQVQYLVRQMAGYAVKFSVESGSKEARAYPVSAQAGAENIKLVKGSWNQAFLDEVSLFPYGTNDDQIDAMSRAFNRLTGDKRQTTGLPQYIGIDSLGSIPSGMDY